MIPFRNLAFTYLSLSLSLVIVSGCSEKNQLPVASSGRDAGGDAVEVGPREVSAAHDAHVDAATPDVAATSPADAGVPDAAAIADAAPMMPPPMPDAAAPPPMTKPDANPGGQPSAMSIAVYDEATIVDFHLAFPAGEYDKLLTLTGPSDARWVTCSFRALGSADVPAVCKRKGNMTDWRFEKKPQIVVKFNHLDKQARWHGLRRLNLESFDGTEAPIRDRVGMWMMREAGIDAPRVNHARVFKDGAYLGLYQNIEVEDKEFLEDHFGADGNGNLWEEGEELKTNETTPDRSRLNMLDVLVGGEPLGGDHTAFFGKADALIDVDQILREMAAETVLLADDNFANGSSNYNLYEHPRRGFLVLPWDLDSILTDAPSSADLYNYLGVSSDANKLRLLMNQNPAWKAAYDDHLVNLRDAHFARIPAKVDAVCAQIRDAVASDPNRSSNLAAFDADCAKVKASVVARIAFIKQALGR